MSIDPHNAPSSRNLDYLLDDDEEPKHGGAWKFVLIVIALALAGGFGYLRWKGQSLPGLGIGGHKPSAAAENSVKPEAGAADSSSSSAAPAAPASAANQSAASAPTAADSAAATPNSANPTPSASPSPAGQVASPAVGAAQPNSSADASASGTSSAGAAATQPSAANDTTSTSPASAPPTAPTKPAPSHPLAKPPAAIPARISDPVAMAQRYIYGKGVPQDCDRGLRLLKPAADQGNSKAMVEMGALYSAGLCTPRDLPTAYRWFALALRKDPGNQSVATDLQKLWGEMTQPERQLAIRLSQ